MSTAVRLAASHALEAVDLKVELGGKNVLDVPSLEVFQNEVLVIVGPNGSGKTTLLLALALLVRPASGKLCFDGKPADNDAYKLTLRRRHAMVFQEPLLLSGTVSDNVSLGLRLRGVKAAEIKSRTLMWLERFGIASLADRQANALSGGEAKRASLARAFVLEPDVLFLDEPFNGLDSPTRQALIEDFEGVLRETRVTTVMVTHDRNEALALAQRVAVLINGRIRQIGSPQEVFSSPVDDDVAAFVESGNILSGVIASHSEGIAIVAVNGGQLDAVADLAAGTQVTVSLPYDAVTIELPRTGMASTSARNHLAGVVTRVFPVGSQVSVTVDCGFPVIALITARSAVEMGLAPGLNAVMSFKASSVHLIPHSQDVNADLTHR